MKKHSNVIKFVPTKTGKDYGGGVKVVDAEKKNDFSLAPSEVEEIQGKYEKLNRRIKKLRKTNNTTQIDIVTLEYLLDMTKDLIPIAIETHKKYKSDKSSYVIVALTNQVRELMNDIRQQSTGTKQCDWINNKILIPNLQLLMQNYMTECADLSKHISKLPRKDRERINSILDDLMQNHGVFFNNVMRKVQLALSEYLVGK